MYDFGGKDEFCYVSKQDKVISYKRFWTTQRLIASSLRERLVGPNDLAHNYGN